MKENKRGCLFFAGVAVMFAVIGSAADVLIFDLLSILSLLWAWVVYETEEKEDD